MRALILVLAVALAAVFWSLRERRQDSSPIEFLAGPAEGPGDLSKLWPVPEFSLTDRTGRTITLADLKGHVWAADFVYTTCPGPCRILSSGMHDIQKALAMVPEARFVSISSDPEKDTPAVLQQYASQFGATDQWLFLTGDKASVLRPREQGVQVIRGGKSGRA